MGKLYGIAVFLSIVIYVSSNATDNLDKKRQLFGSELIRLLYAALIILFIETFASVQFPQNKISAIDIPYFVRGFREFLTGKWVTKIIFLNCTGLNLVLFPVQFINIVLAFIFPLFCRR